MSYFFLIPVSILIGLIALAAFFWNLRHGQYDDLAGSAARILAPNEAPVTPAPPQKGPGG